MLVEVLTYLDKGLSLTGCPVDGMDKHRGGMFEILGPVSKETATRQYRKALLTVVAARTNNEYLCYPP